MRPRHRTDILRPELTGFVSHWRVLAAVVGYDLVTRKRTTKRPWAHLAIR